MDNTKLVKKSTLQAKDYFDYEKLRLAGTGFLPCGYKEDGEDILFTYDMEGMKPLKEILEEPKEQQYHLLINFAMLEKAYMEYQIPVTLDELYYDENYLVYVRDRDLYEEGKKGKKEDFLVIYKSFAGGILSRRYTVEQILESGLSILKNERGFQKIYQCDSVEAVKEELAERKRELKEKTERTKRLVSKRSFRIWRAVAVAAVILACGFGAYTVYSAEFIIPKQEAVIGASQKYIMNDFIGCIDMLEGLKPEEMDPGTKYILAVSYAKSESLKQEEIASIVERLSPETSERELDYWIYLGRRDLGAAENIAMALSDDKLLVYAYMKEADILESDTSMDGTEKKQRLDTLEQEITKLGAKYETEEAEE